MQRRYLIEIVWISSGESEQIEIFSNNIKWSMDQYARNREPFNWKIVKIEDH
jgi:hypothetical protein